MNCPHCKKQIEDQIILSESARIRGKITSEKRAAASRRNAALGAAARQGKKKS